MEKADLPPAGLTRKQAAWLVPAREWLLRRAGIARRRRVLDLGAGIGAVTGELNRRSEGQTVALDRNLAALRHNPALFGGSGRVGGATWLPFAGQTFDLVFCQLVLMWVPLPESLDEIGRVLGPGGTLVALEPDYGGMIEHPPEIATKNLWIAGLTRSGGDPLVGRKLPGALAERGFDVRVELFSEMVPPVPERFALLKGLDLTPTEKAKLQEIEGLAEQLAGTWEQVVHLPFTLVTAARQ